MAFGISVGDFIAAIKLCAEIVDVCSSAEGAPKSHKDFQDIAGSFQIGLKNILKVIEDRNNIAESIPGNAGAIPKYQNDEDTENALRAITADFKKTLETIRELLKKYPINGFGRRMRFWIDAEDEVQELIDRCRHHITTINFLLEPFKNKILTDIRQALRELNIMVLDVGEGVHNVEEGIHGLHAMLKQMGCVETEAPFAPRPRMQIEVPPVPAKASDSIDYRLQHQLRDDRRVELKEVLLEELTKSVVWWLEKGRIENSDINAPARSQLDPLKYLNLRKAIWIVNGFEENQQLQNSNDIKSLWHVYCKKLKKEVHEIYSTAIGAFKVPSAEAIHCLKPSDFTVLVEFDDIETEDLALERHGEICILDIQLPSTPNAVPIHLLVFRQGSGNLRCVEVVRTKSQGVIKETTKEYIISRAEWNLRPFYAFSPGPNMSWNLALYNEKETKTYTFSSAGDLFAFQHAMTVAQTIYVSAGYDCLSSVQAPEFHRIEYQEAGFGRSMRGFPSGLLQLWFEKLRPRIVAPGNTPSSESWSPTTHRTPTWSTASTITASIGSATIHQDQRDQSVVVVEVKPVEVSRVFAIVMNEKGTRSFITFPLGDHITHNNTSCCNNHHPHNRAQGLRRKSVPALESEMCCQRLVIETVTNGGKFAAQILEAPKGDDDANNLLGMTLDEKRLPAGSKTVKLSWFAVTFATKTEKLRFVKNYQHLETIRRTRMNTGGALISGLRGEESRPHPPLSPGRPDDDFFSKTPLRRSSTTSTGRINLSAILRRPTNRS